MNFSSGTEKKICFFFPLRGNTIFGYEWINHQRTFPCKKKNTVTLKLILLLLIRNSVRENKKPCVKKFIFVCVKIYSQYVKISEKVYVKNPNCAWKFWKKCTWKAASIREKNEKIAKKTFHAHFLFSREKKTLIWFRYRCICMEKESLHNKTLMGFKI